MEKRENSSNESWDISIKYFYFITVLNIICTKTIDGLNYSVRDEKDK